MAASLFQDKMIVYVDAFNLYYRLLKNTPYKWLDIYAFVKSQFPNDIVEIKYFYAKVKPSLLDQDAPVRQKQYINALELFLPTKCPTEFIEGYFMENVTKTGIDPAS